MNSLTPLLSPFLSAFQSFTHISGGSAPCKRGFRARTNCHGCNTISCSFFLAQGKYAKRKSRFKRSDGSTSSDTTSNSFVRQVTFHANPSFTLSFTNASARRRLNFPLLLFNEELNYSLMELKRMQLGVPLSFLLLLSLISTLIQFFNEAKIFEQFVLSQFHNLAEFKRLLNLAKGESVSRSFGCVALAAITPQIISLQVLDPAHPVLTPPLVSP